MRRLFSSFDPSSGVWELRINWISMACIILIPVSFWTSKDKINFSKEFVLESLRKEVNLVNFKGYSYSLRIVMMSFFVMIFMNNFLGLIPYVFTSTRHLAIVLPISLSLWVRYIGFSRCINFLYLPTLLEILCVFLISSSSRLFEILIQPFFLIFCQLV